MTPLVAPVQRTVPKDWAAQLADLSPRSESLSWLRLRWEPGYPWEHVERWIIDEMLPPQAVMPDVLLQLQRDTPPQGYYDAVKGEYVPEDGCLITKTAHRLYHETGCWARPWWVIQGTRGGHKRWFSPNEKKLLRLARLPVDPPAPGDLPYAPFDNRVREQIMKHDLLRDEQGRVRDALSQKKILTLLGFRRREEEDAREFRKHLLTWLGEQVLDIAPDAHKALLKLDAPRKDIDVKRVEAAQEQAEETFIETGRVSGLH